VLISLSLPDASAFTLFDAIHAAAQVRKVPIIGLSVKTASAEQERAKAAGFTEVIFKPIDAQEVYDKLAKALDLDTSGQYFAQRDGVLVVKLPAGFAASTAQDVEKYLQAEVTRSVDAGSDKVAVDLSELQQVDAVVVKLCGRVVKLCQDLGLRHVLVGSEGRINDCVNYADTQGWRFAPNWAGALAVFDKKALAA
jgi:two-component system cell cycle response regulator